MPDLVVGDFLDRCHSEHLFPAASIGVFHQGKTTFYSSGFLSPEKPSTNVTFDTLFDLASITKPVATATSILILREKIGLDIDKPISYYLTEFKPHLDKSGITVRHLLLHLSGLPAWEPLYLFCNSRQEMVQYIADKPLDFRPGTQVTYSCLGFIVLAELVTRLTGMTLSAFTQKYIFQPLGMRNTFFNPPVSLKHAIAPTEKGNAQEQLLCRQSGFGNGSLRSGRIHGIVHDSNAFKADGEGGNAGLFSSSRDLMTFIEFMINPGTREDILSVPSILLASTNHTTAYHHHRGLGWQIADSSPASKQLFSDSAFGHNGFTGTSLWIDAQKRIAVVFLTNRVYFDGSAKDFNSTRAALHELIFKNLTMWR
ncbi:MAG: serine hydrolase domain-containing protein [bacterium]